MKAASALVSLSLIPEVGGLHNTRLVLFHLQLFSFFLAFSCPC